WFSAAANGNAPLGTNDLVNYFVMSGKASRYGCWGATEDLKFIAEPGKAPKYEALCELSGKCGNEPKIEITAPLNNFKATLNEPVSISTTVSDSDGKVEKVEFFEGSKLIGVDSIAPFNINWTPKQLGIHGFIAKAVDNDNKYSFTDMTLVEVLNKVSSTQNNPAPMSLTLAPNPASNRINIMSDVDLSQNAIYQIIDMYGIKRSEGQTSGIQSEIDVNHLDEGIYFLQIRRGELLKTMRFVKIK
ncbi:MAG: Ig-like domain-containing protein, partial [Saprospiraceae bacterium]